MRWLQKRRETTLALNDMIWKERKLIVVILGIMCIPLLYSGIYLTAFFDPYEQMENLSVAVVNEDEGAKSDGEEVNVGKELVDGLKDDDKFGWEFVDRAEMKKGLEKGEYHLAVVIPKDFSKHAISLKDPKPLKGKIEYHANEGVNYLSSQIGNRMIQGLEDSVKEKLIHAYAVTFFDKMDESADKLDEAAEGASELAGGTKKAEGATGELVDGAFQLSSGVNRLDQAIGQLSAGVKKLVAGLHTATTGANQLSDGADELESGIAKGMKDLPRLKDGATQIRDGIGQFKNIIHNPKLERGASVISGIARKLKGNSDEADQLYTKIVNKHPELADDPEMAQLKKTLDKTRSDHESLLDRAARLEQDLKQAQNSVDKMYDGQTQVVNGIGALQNGMKELHSGVSLLSTKLGELEDGLNQLEAGGQKLEQGMGQLAEAPKRLSDGLAKLSAGMKQLGEGLHKISDGQHTLADKLAEGVNAAREALEGKDQKADQMADPVKVDDHNLHPVPNYATGFAPYFISLSLWVGAMILFTVLDAKRPMLNDERPFSGLSTLLMGTLQALLLILVLIYFVGIEPVNEGWLYLFAILTGIVFTAINHFLVAAFKDVGRFIAILILMFQLTSSSGTYTVDLLPSFFQAVSPFLPMTYSIQGLRAAISTGDTAVILANAKILLGIGAGAWLLRMGALQLWKVVPGKLNLRLKSRKTATDN